MEEGAMGEKDWSGAHDRSGGRGKGEKKKVVTAQSKRERDAERGKTRTQGERDWSRTGRI